MGRNQDWEHEVDRETFFIGGEWVEPAGTGTLPVISPATEEVIATVPDATVADVDRAVSAARDAFDRGPWPRMTPAERADVMAAMSLALQARSEEIARTITEEMGSPISFSIFAQALATTMVLDYYVGLARDYPFEERRAGAISSSLIRREAVGVVGAIVPWNIPLLCAMAKVAPALASGSTVVLKPAPETPLNAYLLAEAAMTAGLPPGVINIVQTGREVGERIVNHPGVDKISFTGSTLAGQRIASLCGQQMKRCTLELGGKSAAIILDDADLSAVIPQLMPAALLNNGEACIAQTRILAPQARYGEVVDALVAGIDAQRVGDPLDPETTIGPLFAQRHRERVERYIATGNEEGAKLVVGGGRPSGFDKGWYVEPTLFADVDNTMTIAQEEIFGPVLAAITYDDVDDAIAIANDSNYGLSGSVWTSDLQAGLDVARRVRTGTFGINGLMSDFGSPAGGFKQSGIGRELGPEGLEAYLELKTIVLPDGFESARSLQ
jgi:aldehyde dehydrogenase (NAD+)